MHRFLRAGFVPALLLCLTLLTQPASAEWKTLSYNDAGFRALFPAQPDYSSETMTDLSEPYVLHTYIAQAGDLFFAVTYGAYPASYVFDPAAELKANQDNFNSGVEARLLTSRQTTYERAAGDTLPALEFMSESEAFDLKGIVIMDGQKAYMAVAGNKKGIDAADETDRLIGSFRLLPH